MGFLDLFKKKEEVPEEVADETDYKVLLSDAANWMNTQFDEKLELARRRATSISSDAIGAISKARDGLSGLEKSSFGGKEKIYVSANMAKDSFVRRARSVIGSLRLPSDVKSYYVLMEFQKKMETAINEINNISPKQLYLLSRYFKNDSIKFMERIKNAENSSNELKTFLKGDGLVMKMESMTRKSLSMIEQNLNKESKLLEEENAIESEMKNLENLKKKFSLSVEQLQSSKESLNAKKLADSIGKGNETLSMISTSANEILNPARRSIKKLRHASTKEGNSFPSDPFTDMILAGQEARLEAMICLTIESANEGRIIIKDRDMDKLRNALKSLNKDVGELKSKYLDERLRVEEMKKELSSSTIMNRINDAQKSFEETEERLRAKWSELDLSMRERKDIRSEIEKIKTDAEKMVLDIGKKRLQIMIKISQ